MSVATTFIPTPSSSLLLIRNVSTPTFVYLSSFNAPNFNISIRDTTGLSTLQTTPVRISTVGNARFIDGTSLYLLDKPYGFVNIGFRNSSFWQILHTSGQAPSTSAANVTTLNVSSLTLDFLSSGTKRISSLLVNDFTTTNSFSLVSPFIITNLSAPGIVVVQSTFNVYGDVLLDKQLYVSGPTTFRSSLFVNTLLPISSPVRVISSIGVGGTMSVGGILTVGSTFHTLSTNFVETLEIQKSTSQTTFEVFDSFRVQGLLSTLLNTTVLDTFTSLSTLEILQNVSSLSGTFSTQTLHVRDFVSVTSTISTFGNTTFLSTLHIGKNLLVTGDGFLSTNLFVQNNLFTSSFSSLLFSSLGSLSTQTLTLTSTAFLSSGLSTALLQGNQWISIGSDFFTVATLSSMRLTTVKGVVSSEGENEFGSVHVSTSVGVGDQLTVQQSSFVGSALFEKHVCTLGHFYTLGYTEILGNVGVGDSVFVNSNIVIQDGSEISSFFVNSFVLSNLDILTSSPFTAFTASSLNASSLLTSNTEIGITNPPNLFVYSTFASTTQFSYTQAEALVVESVRASNVLFGTKQTSLAESSQPRFVMNEKSLFPQGLSAQTVRFDILNTNNVQASFLGDGANISNVAVPFSHLSALKSFASTSIITSLFASTMNVSSFTDIQRTNVVSSFITPTLVFESIGFPLRYETNQVLAKDSNTMIINRGLTFDRRTNTVGINTSSPQYTLDINGLIFASNIFFSSINALQISTLSTFTFSSIYASSVYVRDTLVAGISGIKIASPNPFLNDTTPFSIESRSNGNDISSLFGLYSFPSTIAISYGTYVYNNTQRVRIPGAGFVSDVLPNATSMSTPYDLNVYDTLKSIDGYFSTVNITSFVQTNQLVAPSVFFQGSNTISTNTLSTTAGKLIINNLLTVSRLSSGAIGVKTTDPLTNLDIRGNAYFSSVSFSGPAKANFLSLGSLFA
jgi:hypothetical protein